MHSVDSKTYHKSAKRLNDNLRAAIAILSLDEFSDPSQLENEAVDESAD
jgi:hypothetical protein